MLWRLDVTSWQILIYRCASRKALRSHHMTEIPSTLLTRWAITITPSSTNWCPASSWESPKATCPGRFYVPRMSLVLLREIRNDLNVPVALDLNGLAGPWIELETRRERLLQVFDENPYLSGHPAARRPYGKDRHCSFKRSE